MSLGARSPLYGQTAAGHSAQASGVGLHTMACCCGHDCKLICTAQLFYSSISPPREFQPIQDHACCHLMSECSSVHIPSHSLQHNNNSAKEGITCILE